MGTPGERQPRRSAFHVSILGPTLVEVAGREVDLGGTRQRQLVALLVVRRNQAVPVDELADRLWPEEQPATAVKTIQVYVSRLRSLLGAEADRLETVAGGYRFRIGDDEVDAVRFESLVRQGHAQLAADPRVAETTLVAAMALWRGPAINDLATLPIGRGEAERLDELREAARDDVDEAMIRTGRAREAVARLTTAVRERPERERTWAKLMRALYADGRQADALAAYRRARTYLSSELGLEPGPELRALEVAILRQDLDVPTALPELRPVDAVETRARATSGAMPAARPRPLALTPRPAIVALAAVVLVVVSAAVLLRPGIGPAAVGASPTSGVGPRVADQSPAPASPAATPMSIVVAPDLDDGLWRPTVLPPGSWVWSAFQPPAAFTTTTTWFGGADLADGAILLHLDPADATNGRVTWEIDFVRARLVLDRPCYLPVQTRILDAGASSFIAWLQDHPLLKLDVVRPFNVGSFPGFAVDATVAREKTSADCPEDASQSSLLRRIPLFPAVGHAFPLFAHDKARFIAADVGDGPPLIIIVRADASVWDAAIAEAEPVLNSLQLAP